MKTRVVFVILLAVLSGCCVSEKTKAHIDTQISAHAGYERLINSTLAGELTGDGKGDNVSAADLKATPATVKKLLTRTFKAIHKSKLSYHTLKFSLGNGKDHAGLDLGEAPALPSGADDVLSPNCSGDPWHGHRGDE